MGVDRGGWVRRRAGACVGDPRHAVGVVIAARGQALKRYAFLLCGDDAGAEDLVQESLTRALSRRGRIPGDPHELELYLRRIVLNLVVDQSRRAKRWKLLLPRASTASATHDVSDEVCLRLSVGEALAQLAPRQRACVVLHYYEDMTVQDVAAHLECAEGTVKAQLHAARRTLARLVRTDALRQSVDANEGTRP